MNKSPFEQLSYDSRIANVWYYSPVYIGQLSTLVLLLLFPIPTALCAGAAIMLIGSIVRMFLIPFFEYLVPLMVLTGGISLWIVTAIAAGILVLSGKWVAAICCILVMTPIGALLAIPAKLLDGLITRFAGHPIAIFWLTRTQVDKPSMDPALGMMIFAQGPRFSMNVAEASELSAEWAKQGIASY